MLQFINIKTIVSFLFTMALLVITSFSYGQKISVLKKEVKADDYCDRSDFLNAYNTYKEIIAEDSSDSKNYFKAGFCLFMLNKNDSTALKYLLKSSENILEAHYYIGRIYLINNNLYEALNEFLFLRSKYNNEVEISLAEVDRWIKITQQSIEESVNKKDIKIRNLGAGINTEFQEYSPVLLKENILAYTSRRPESTGGKKDAYGSYFEDIYATTKIDTSWSVSTPISKNINTTTHDASVAFISDSNCLVLYRTDAKQTGGDLYTSCWKENEWTTPILLGQEINSEYQDPSAAFSSDGNFIVFSSNRPRGFGGKDLYRIVKLPNGKYSKALNLGPNINTAYDEDSPFISTKNGELFFSSNGHNTNGGYDVYKSVLEKENSLWSNPQNMGMPINSTADDIYFILKEDGFKGYISSNRIGGRGGMDLYEVDIREPEERLSVIVGKIKTENEEKIDFQKLQITLLDITTGQLVGKYKLKKNHNTFILIVEKGREYKILVEGNEIESFIQSMTMIDDEINLTVKKKIFSEK